MKVMHLISGGDTGGAKTHVITLLKELHKNVSIELICLAEGSFEQDARAAGISTSVMKQESRFDLRVIKLLKQKIVHEGFEILHCHGARANFVGAFLKKHIHIPMITTVHSDYRLDFAHNFYKKIIFTKLNRFGLNKMDYYLAVTDMFKQMLIQQKFDANKIHIIYNGINSEAPLKDYLSFENRELVFGCVTRLVPIKGTHLLLEATKICVEKGYKPKVKIAGMGAGAYVDGLHRYVKENGLGAYVEFVGYITEINGFYDQIDVNILPSYTESFPYALLEGGIRGIGTIASKAGGIIEMFTDDTGRLFEVGNSQDLAVKMIELLDHPDRIQQLGLRFKQRIVDNFSDVAMAKRHIEIYREILSKKNS
jgi:L-malate glycosyltransferase